MTKHVIILKITTLTYTHKIKPKKKEKKKEAYKFRDEYKGSE